MRGLKILRVLLGRLHAEVSRLLPLDIGRHLSGWDAALVSRDVKADNIGLSMVSSLADIIGEADPGISRQGGISQKYALSGIRNGCLSKDRGGYRFPEPNCYFSACVQKRGLDNCAACSAYPCKRLEERMRACDRVRDKFQDRIPRGAFQKCIAPYDMRATLERLRGRKRMGSIPI